MIMPVYELRVFAGRLGRAIAVPLMAAGLVTGLAPVAGAAAVPCVGMSGQRLPDGFTDGIAVLSPCNIWAAQIPGPGVPGISHWDGTTWTAAQLPSVPGGANFAAIDAFTATDIWAAGSTSSPAGTPDQTLIEHWDGSSWRVSPEQRPAGGFDRLAAVTATSPTNAWAVGYSMPSGDPAGPEQGVIEHWNGSIWTRLPAVPTTGDQSALLGMAVGSPSSAWAVGQTITTSPRQEHGLVLHWNGSSWSQQSIPANVTILSGVTAVSANNAWAVGRTGTTKANRAPVILHWDGSSWQTVSTPSVPRAELFAVTATSASDAWAVGGRPGLVEHWDGTSWTMVPMSAGVSVLRAVAASAPGNVWAVGGDADSHELALRLEAG